MGLHVAASPAPHRWIGNMLIRSAAEGADTHWRRPNLETKRAHFPTIHICVENSTLPVDIGEPEAHDLCHSPT